MNTENICLLRKLELYQKYCSHHFQADNNWLFDTFIKTNQKQVLMRINFFEHFKRKINELMLKLLLNAKQLSYHANLAT